MKKIFRHTIFKLLIGIALGLVIGNYISESALQIVLSLKHFLGQIIYFIIPLIVISFVGASITKLSNNSSHILGFTLVLAYIMSVAAAFYALVLGYTVLPSLNIQNHVASLKELPKQVFQLDIPPIVSVMTALFLAFVLGIGALRTKAKLLENLLDELKNIVTWLIEKLLLPIIPIFVGLNFTVLSYEGAIQQHLPVFLKIVVLAIVAHWVWLLFLYVLAFMVSKKNPWKLIKNYIPAYVTAMGTMSSMATLGVTLSAVRKSNMIEEKVSNFTIPFLANIHLCGSVITIVIFSLTVSQVLYGQVPDWGTMLLFIMLLGVFAVSAPGVPGGTVVASMGLIAAVLGFDEAGLALLLSIFALQDSFGTATNVVSDGALSLVIETYHNRKKDK